jgi:hypothetical protein
MSNQYDHWSCRDCSSGGNGMGSRLAALAHAREQPGHTVDVWTMAKSPPSPEGERGDDPEGRAGNQ